MATLALITLPLAGHMNPMIAAARALARWGHRPVVVGPVDLTDRLPSDIEAYSIGESDWPKGALTARCSCLSQMKTLRDFRNMLALVAEHSALYFEHLPAALNAIGANGVIHDQLEPAAGIVAKGLNRQSQTPLAHISLACALPMNREAMIPPPLLGWAYRNSAYGAWLHQGYYRIVDRLLSEQGQVLANGAARFGLTKPEDSPSWQEAWSVNDGISDRCDLAQGLACLDYPREAPPLYLGPLRSAGNPYPGLESLTLERDGRPLCFISLGTLMGHRTTLLLSMAKAAHRRGLQPLIVHGGRLPPSAITALSQALPKGSILRDFVNQRDVMAGCEAAIIHGGYNSTTDAVTAGLPLVIVPIAFEQGAIAARVERARLGRSVSMFGPCLSQRIRLALGDVLASDTVRDATRNARFEALAAPGVQGLVDRVEAAIQLRSAVAERGPAAPRAPAPVRPNQTSVIGWRQRLAS